MRFMPHTDGDVAAMLETIGAKHLDDLIAHVPANLRASAKINLDAGRSEADVVHEISSLAARNTGASGFASFLGAGYYRHYVPAAVRAVIARAEFATSYTPYQAEASQGTTQAIFEFQTLITQLTAMEVANASMYDGASAAAEAVLMARRLMPKRSVVALSRALWPDYRATIRTYLSALHGIEIVEVPFDDATGATDAAALDRIANDRLLCTVTGYPNAFGVIEPLGAITENNASRGRARNLRHCRGHRAGSAARAGRAWRRYRRRRGSEFRAAASIRRTRASASWPRATAHMRQMPGRLVGQTRDRDGRRAFCLTLNYARAAYPPRTRDLEHLHQSFAVRAGRDGLSLAAGPQRTARSGRAQRRAVASARPTCSRRLASGGDSRGRSSTSSR